MEDLSTIAPSFARVIEHVSAQNVFQKRAIARYLSTATEQDLKFADDVVRRLARASLKRKDDPEYLAEAYVNYTKSIRAEELFFAKQGQYRQSEYKSVYDEIYGRDEVMMDYVAGLGMTQVLWPNHYAIVRFFLSQFIPSVSHASTGAEIGVGHGLFHSELLRGAPELRTRMLDVSSVSLQTTTNMIHGIGLDPLRAEPIICDVQEEIPLEMGSLDVLLAGEVVEHLEQGERVMAELTSRMKFDGYCFFTTAANAPAEDHLLLFKTTAEIRDFLGRTGWQVIKEHLGTLRGLSVEESEEGGHNINYAAILKRAQTPTPPEGSNGRYP